MILESHSSRYIFAGFIVPVVLSVAITALDLVSIAVLTKCIRISRQQKTLTLNLLISDSTMHLILVIFILLTVFIQDPTIKFVTANVLTLLLGAVALMYFALVIVIAFDRLLAIRFPYKYWRIMSHSNVKRIITVIYSAVAVLIVWISISIPLNCRDKFTTCRTDMANAFRPAEAIQIALLTLADVIVASAGVYIFKVSKEHASRLHSQYPSARLNTEVTARRIIIHVGVFIFIYSSTFIFDALRNLAYFNFSRQTYFIARTLTYVCILANSIASLYYYVFVLTEFRLVCRRIFCLWHSNLIADYERRRVEIYNIPTSATSVNRTL